MVPLDFRLLTFGLEGESVLDGLCSKSIDEEDEVLAGDEADGSGYDCDAELVGMGAEFEADIAASLLCSCVRPKD